MKVIGIICEYNPLHNGHVYHFNEVVRLSSPDVVICSMSSSFTQRGDLAILDKFTRAKLALELGVDVVLECPSILSMNEASIFAEAHVKTLSNAGVCEIWIGSEMANSEFYEKYYKVYKSKKFNQALKEYLDLGLSYKIAFKKAIESFDLKPLAANDLLGLFYYEAILKINPNIKLKTIKRTNRYDDDKIEVGDIQSATAIRANLEDGINYVPEYTKKVLPKAFDENKFLPYIKYQVAAAKPEFLAKLVEATEGLENRLPNSSANTIEEYIDSLSTKRYSKTKIKRLLMDVLLGFTKYELETSISCYNFIRLLGFNQRGKAYLNTLKDKQKMYANIKDGLNPVLDSELRATRIIDLVFGTNIFAMEQKGPVKSDKK